MNEFKRVQAAGTDINNELLKIWVARYLPNLEAISKHARPHVEQRLRRTISDESRNITATKLDQHLASDCVLAATDTQQLLVTAGIKADTWEIQSLSVQIHSIYEALINRYRESFVFSPIIEYLHLIDIEGSRLAAAARVIPKFENLLLIIAPMLRELEAIYFSSLNQHLVGFMTTQLHLTQQRIISHLSSEELIWLTPYLKLLNELICMPWKHICSATSVSHNVETIALVKRMMPKVSSIATLTYQKALQTFPNHTSYQGRIQSQSVQHSSLRDLSMFQAYIWLSVLEDSSSVIEKKLLPICLQVFPLTGVRWELVTFAIGTIIDIIQEQLSPTEQELFKAHAEYIKALFFNAQPKMRQVHLLKEQLKRNKTFSNVSYTWRPVEQ
ncbi:MAG: hypothetical protein KTR27_03810 [Leptolyngbyaceae cyanobacterium MAG.088]|nr:hypothetical protein [Leptolyngbyaceae cyanobacterium MAG.088]